jgi:hypothetical protein
MRRWEWKLTIQIIACALTVLPGTLARGGVVVVSMDIDTAIRATRRIERHSLLEAFVEIMEFRIGDRFIGNLFHGS